MFIWADPLEITCQLETLGRDFTEVTEELQKAEDKSLLEWLLRIQKNHWKVIDFAKKIEQDEYKRQLAMILYFLQRPLNVCVYPEYDTISSIRDCVRGGVLENLYETERFYNNGKPVIICDDGSCKPSEWEAVKWSYENPQLIEIMGIIDLESLCFYPFKRPTNNSVVIDLDIDEAEFSQNRLRSKVFSPFKSRGNINKYYTMCVAKFFNHQIIPLYFYDALSPECLERVKNYIDRWLTHLDIERIYDFDSKNWNDYVIQITEQIINNGLYGADKNMRIIDYMKSCPILEDPNPRLSSLTRAYVKIQIIWGCNHEQKN